VALKLEKAEGVLMKNTTMTSDKLLAYMHCHKDINFTLNGLKELAGETHIFPLVTDLIARGRVDLGQPIEWTSSNGHKHTTITYRVAQ